STVAEQAPRLAGGIAVAPRSFGRFAGQLIAPDEVGGGLVAIDAGGRATTVVDSGLATGGDIGVESVGFVPTRFGARGAAFLADRARRETRTRARTTSSRSQGRRSSVQACARAICWW